MEGVGNRLGLPRGHGGRDAGVLASLRELLYALSEASYCLRVSSFDDQHVKRLLAVQRKKV